RHSDNDRNVALGLLRQYVPPVELPEIRIARPLHRPLYRHRSRVVCGHGEIPIAKLVVEVLQMSRSRVRSLFWILPLIDPPVALQAVSAGPARHELPHTASACPRQRQWMETRFGLRKIDQILWNALFLENPRDHLAVPS